MRRATLVSHVRCSFSYPLSPWERVGVREKRKGNGLPMFKFAKNNSVHHSQPVGNSRPAGLDARRTTVLIQRDLVKVTTPVSKFTDSIR